MTHEQEQLVKVLYAMYEAIGARKDLERLKLAVNILETTEGWNQ